MAEEMALRTADAGDVIQTDLGPLVIPEGMGGHYVVAGSLDAAWAEAEAALPERHGGLHLNSYGDWGRIDGWSAHTFAPRQPTITATGPTPAAALRALAAKLREREG